MPANPPTVTHGGTFARYTVVAPFTASCARFAPGQQPGSVTLRPVPFTSIGPFITRNVLAGLAPRNTTPSLPMVKPLLVYVPGLSSTTVLLRAASKAA